jgi:hypothetical protein
VEGEPALAAEHDDIARGEFQRAGGIAAARAPDAEQARVAQRDRDDRGSEFLLVTVLVQAHAGAGRVAVDEAGFRIMRIARHLPPQVEHHRRYRRPRLAGVGMGRLVAVAALAVRYPAERPEIGHADRQRLARAGHRRDKERRRRHCLAEYGDQFKLASAIEETRQDSKARTVTGRLRTHRARTPELPQRRGKLTPASAAQAMSR